MGRCLPASIGILSAFQGTVSPPASPGLQGGSAETSVPPGGETN
jgi:hypothetical protein